MRWDSVPPAPEQKSTRDSLIFSRSGISSNVLIMRFAASSAGEAFWSGGTRCIHAAVNVAWALLRINDGHLRAKSATKNKASVKVRIEQLGTNPYLKECKGTRKLRMRVRNSHPQITNLKQPPRPRRNHRIEYPPQQTSPLLRSRASIGR